MQFDRSEARDYLEYKFLLHECPREKQTMGIGLWETEGMKKPSLVIIKRQGRNPVVGTCSSCPQTRFSTERKFGKPSEHERELRDLFDQHFRTVHMREDFSQELRGS